MFIDTAKIKVKAGDGGNGVVSFRKEKFIDRGGPDGGDGGDGGDIVLISDPQINTLSYFRKKQLIKARNGKPGGKRRARGKSADDVEIKVPVGAVVVREGTVVADLSQPHTRFVVAYGGKGGYGNAHFKSSTRRAPKVAEKGEKGEEYDLELELKLLADVGLVGLPNAGKSTFSSSVTGAKPKIADYPFTTLSPNLGVADIGKTSLLIADIPGLIEGASKGKGLGDEFLRHIERTAVILHLLDLSDDKLLDNYRIIRNELKSYKADLSQKPEIVALNKSDLIEESEAKKRKSEFDKKNKVKSLVISSVKKQNINQVLNQLNKKVQEVRNQEVEDEAEAGIPVYELDLSDRWEVLKTKGGFEVKGRKIARFAGKTDFDNEYSVRRLRDILRKTGIEHALVKNGIKPGDKVKIGRETLTWE